MLKVKRIKLAIENIDMNSALLTKVSFVDIRKYAKSNNLKWAFMDIGVKQKIDLIKSIIKHN